MMSDCGPYIGRAAVVGQRQPPALLVVEPELRDGSS
jgi:hypothetical protein